MTWGDVYEFIKKVMTYAPPEDAKVTLFENLTKQLDQKISGWLLEQVTRATQLLIKYLLSTPLHIMNSPYFREIYWLVAKLSLATLLPFLGYFGLRIITGQTRMEDVSRTFWRIMLMPAFILFAPYFVKKLILFINQISEILLNSKSFTGGYVPQHLDIVTILVVISFLYLMFKLILYYAMRNFFLMAHVAISPVFYLIWSMPGRYDKFNKWCQEITTLLTTQLIHIIELLLLLSITKIDNNSFDGLIFQIGALIVMNKTSDWIGEYLDSSLQFPDVKVGKYVRYLKSPKNMVKGFKNIFK